MRSQLFEFETEQLQNLRRLLVVGDLHGDYDALRSLVSIFDPSKEGVIFLGDYADRGESGVEVINAVDDLLESHPHNILAIKGNHEDYPESGIPRFRPWTLSREVSKKTGDWQSYFRNTLKPFILKLFLAVIAPGEVLFVHGGVSSKPHGLDDLRSPSEEIETDILWSDPFEGTGEHANPRGLGVEFGENITLRACDVLGVKKIVRSHEPARALQGPLYSHSGRVITVSSTSIYGGDPFALSIDPTDFSQIDVVKL